VALRPYYLRAFTELRRYQAISRNSGLVADQAEKEVAEAGQRDAEGHNDEENPDQCLHEYLTAIESADELYFFMI
jgi:hypothetical protein